MKKPQNKFSIFFLALSIGLVAISSTSCNKKNNDFEVSLRGDRVNLFQADMISCKALADQAVSTDPATPDITAISFELPQITVSVPAEKSVKLVYIGVELTGSGLSGGVFSCPLLVTDKLNATFKFDGVKKVPVYDTQDVYFPAPNFSSSDPVQWSKSTYCPVKCGGVQMVDKKKNSNGSGRVFVYAINTSNNEPLLNETFFEWDYLGAP